MKKLFVLCTSLIILTLAACSEENTQNSDSNQKETTEKTTTKDQPEATTKTEKEEKESTTSKDTNEADADQVSPFEEYPVVQKEIKDIDSMQPVVETDNPNKRVVLYQEADGKKKYKTIFVKRTDRLKIIELNENGLLFNEVISK